MSEFPFPGEPETIDGDRWVDRGRSTVSAAVIALVGIGAFYFATQIVFTLVGVLLTVHDVSALLALRDSMTDNTAVFDMMITPLRWAVMLSQYAALLLPVLLLIRLWHTRHVGRYIRLRPARIAHIALAVIGTVLIIPIGTVASNLFRSGGQESSDLERLTEKLFTAHSTPEFLFLVFVVAVTPAICEEIFFRGYIQRTFERTMGVHSIALVGVIFGLFHMQPAGLLTLSMIGVWLGFVYNRSRSLLPNMAAHFTNNFIALWLIYRSPVIFGISVADDAQVPLPWALAALIVLAGVIALFIAITPRGEDRAAPAG